MPKILVVEDDRQILKFIVSALHSQDFDCLEATSGKAAMQLITTENPDAVILDLGLPDMDGMEIIHQVREFSELPIIVVSARDRDNEKVGALDSGADDYLTKPFSVKELLARIRVVFRHQQRQPQQVYEQYLCKELKVDFAGHRVHLKGCEVHLTPMEYNLLTLMIKNAGKVLTHRYLLEKIWGSSLESDTQTLRVFMANIRRKLEQNPAEPEYIFTEIGVGYRFTDDGALS